jgi:hypothetical protein
MTANMAEALASLERAATRLEALEPMVKQQVAKTAQLKAEIVASIGELDLLLGDKPHA